MFVLRRKELLEVFLHLLILWCLLQRPLPKKGCCCGVKEKLLLTEMWTFRTSISGKFSLFQEVRSNLICIKSGFFLHSCVGIFDSRISLFTGNVAFLQILMICIQSLILVSLLCYLPWFMFINICPGYVYLKKKKKKSLLHTEWAYSPIRLMLLEFLAYGNI